MQIMPNRTQNLATAGNQQLAHGSANKLPRTLSNPVSHIVSNDITKQRVRPSLKRRMKPEFAFDICHEIYKGAREVLESKRGLYAFDLEAADKYLWRPDIRPRLGEYVADFALAGAAALDSPKLASRLVLFRVYYLGGANYHRARNFLGLSEYTWSQWVDQIRRLGGTELLRRGMFPPRKYFREPS
jgi:hypothetical protein